MDGLLISASACGLSVEDIESRIALAAKALLDSESVQYEEKVTATCFISRAFLHNILVQNCGILSGGPWSGEMGTRGLRVDLLQRSAATKKLHLWLKQVFQMPMRPGFLLKCRRELYRVQKGQPNMLSEGDSVEFLRRIGADVSNWEAKVWALRFLRVRPVIDLVSAPVRGNEARVPRWTEVERRRFLEYLDEETCVKLGIQVTRVGGQITTLRLNRELMLTPNPLLPMDWYRKASGRRKHVLADSDVRALPSEKRRRLIQRHKPGWYSGSLYPSISIFAVQNSAAAPYGAAVLIVNLFHQVVKRAVSWEVKALDERVYSKFKRMFKYIFKISVENETDHTNDAETDNDRVLEFARSIMENHMGVAGDLQIVRTDGVPPRTFCRSVEFQWRGRLDISLARTFLKEGMFSCIIPQADSRASSRD